MALQFREAHATADKKQLNGEWFVLENAGASSVSTAGLQVISGRKGKRDLWLWQLAGQWRRIGQEEPLCGRADEVGDDLGRRVLVGRLVRDVMRLCFLLERRFAPYSKWLGTAFGRLEAAGTVGPLLTAAMTADRWPAAEEALVAAYQEVATRHNRLGLTELLDPAPRQFFDRPWLVLDADRFAVACLQAMADRRLASLQPIGAIDQFVDSTDVLGFRPALCRQIGRVYDATGPAGQGLA